MVRKFFVLGLILVFTLGTISSVFANEVSNALTKEAIMAPEFGPDALTDAQIEFLRQNPDLAKKRTAKDLEYLRNRTEQALLEAVINDSKRGDVSTSSTTLIVRKGQQYTISAADVGNHGGSTSGIGTKLHNTGTGTQAWADARADAYGVGRAGAWAYVGKRIKAEGSFSGEKIPVVITYRGHARGMVHGSAYAGYGAAGEGRVKVVAVDLSSGTIAAEAPIWTGASSDGQQRNCDVSINRQLSFFLISGREYMLYESVGVDGYSLGADGYGTGQFYNNARGGRGIDWTSIHVDAR
ncbi:MAG: hypothetical protein AB1815_03560 [Bacillota bacterium]